MEPALLDALCQVCRTFCEVPGSEQGRLSRRPERRWGIDRSCMRRDVLWLITRGVEAWLSAASACVCVCTLNTLGSQLEAGDSLCESFLAPLAVLVAQFWVWPAGWFCLARLRKFGQRSKKNKFPRLTGLNPTIFRWSCKYFGAVELPLPDVHLKVGRCHTPAADSWWTRQQQKKFHSRPVFLIMQINHCSAREEISANQISRLTWHH